MKIILKCFYINLLFKLTLQTISNPLKNDININKIIPEYQDVKQVKLYYNMTPILRNDIPIINQHLKSCDINAKIKWSASVGSSVYSTPVIFPSGNEGRKQIFLNTFYQYVEVLGDDGFKPWGFPLGFGDSSFQSSPILYDIDGDGVNDMTIIDKNANIYWVRLGDFGQYLEDYHIQVPKLKVKKDWADGMDPAFLDSYVMTSMFDNRFETKNTEKVVRPDDLKIFVKQDSYPEQKPIPTTRKLFSSSSSSSSSLNEKKNEIKLNYNQNEKKSNHWTGRVLMEYEEQQNEEQQNEEENKEEKKQEEIQQEVKNEEKEEENIFENEITENKEKESEIKSKDNKEIQTEPEENIIDSHQELKDINNENPGDLEGVEYGLPQWDEPSGDINPINGGDPFEWTDDYNVHAHRHWERRAYFGDDYLPSGYGWGLNDTHFAFVDPHVLAPATLADINNDGEMELIIPISYYFDKEQYRGKNLDFDPENFIAGGIGCWNVRTEQWNWLVHLDLTTDKTKFKALIHSSPTVADLDGDGRSEVIIGTSLGLLYVLDGDTGFSRRFFPMQFHEIQSQVVVADIRGGTDLEMIVGDLAGNLVCINIEGDILWDARLSGGIYQPATIGDIDGDGQLDVVVSVSAYNGYHIYALRGDTGEILPGYPIALPEGGEVSGAIILVDLHTYTDSSSSSSSSSNVNKPFNPKKYSDPYAPQWTLSSVGHAPAAAPSSLSDLLKKEKESENSNNNENNNNNNENENENGNENKNKEEEKPDDEIEIKRRLDNLDPLTHKLRSGGRVKHSEKKKTSTTKTTNGLHLLVPSFDGHLYIFDGKQTCAERIDIGDHIYSTPLVDDITGDGNLDIIIGTVNGHLHVLETQIPHHPLNTWSSFPKHRGNVFTHGQIGISIPLREKKLLRQTDIKGGNKLSLTFDIWDTREIKETETRKYNVIVTRGTNKIDPITEVEYNHPGRYTIELELSPPEKLNLIIGMYTDHQQYYEDSIQIELSTRFYIWIKYLIVIPLMILVIPLLFMRPQKEF